MFNKYDKEIKLNSLLKDHNGKLNSNMMTKKLIANNGSLVRQKPIEKPNKTTNGSKDERQLSDAPEFFKPDLGMKHEKFESNGRLQGVYKETKPIRKYSTEPIVAMVHQKPSDVYTDASKQYQDGLTAADNGVPSTLNKQLAMMSTKYVKPSLCHL